MTMKSLVKSLCLLVILSLFVVIPAFTAYAENFAAKTPLIRGPVKQINKHFSTQSIIYSGGAILERSIINGPPKPPPGQLRKAVLLPEPMPEMGTNLLTVPAFNWVFGCSAVSAAMIAGYYDFNGFGDIYTGPTDGGQIPLDDSSWGTWTDSAGDLYPNNPLVASHQWSDGRDTFGSIDDYWVSYLSHSNDPYITGKWEEHSWGDAIGDFMKTSQSAYGNVDGSTSFYYYPDSRPLSCDVMELYSNIADEDGTYGRKLFYEARGYKVTDCYTQETDNEATGGFSFAQYKAEIDAGRPVLLNLEGHSVVGFGYDDSSNTVYIHDTWDYNNHTMPWGGGYAGMALWGVSIVNIQEPTPSTPDISVSPNSYDFGNVNISNTSTQTFTISNAGSGNLTIGNIVIAGAPTSDFSLNQDNCTGKTIASLSSCTFRVAFSPTSARQKWDTAIVESNDPDENPLNISLTGTGVIPPQPDLRGEWSNVSWSGPTKRGVYTVSGTFTTINSGSANANNVVVKLYFVNGSNETSIKSYKYRTIAAGSSQAATIRFNTTSYPLGNQLLADIDPSKEIIESDESNNKVYYTIH
jgi:hypothetical protein